MKTYLTMFAIAAVFLAFSALIGSRDRKAREEKERRRLSSAFGKKGNKAYPDGRLAQIPVYFERHPGDFQIDDITWNDLDMDLLYQSMDTTCSSPGEEYLYRLLRCPRTGTGSPLSAEGMKWWTAHEEERIRVQRILLTAGINSKYSVYDYLDRLDSLEDRSPVRDLPAVILPIVSLAVMAYRPPVGICCLLASLAFNMVSYFKVKRQIGPYLFTIRYILRLLRCADRLSGESFPHYEKEKETMKSLVRSFKRFSTGSSILLRNTSGTGSGNPLDLILDYLCILFHLDLFKFSSMVRELRGKEKEIDDLIASIGTIDAQISIASFRESLPFYCIPDLSGSHFEAEGLIHPLLNDPVPNSLHTDRPVLLTGSNASGKSTFLKAAALAALLSQTIDTAPAKSYRNCCCRIYTSMALRDDIRSGESYFIVEIRSLKRVLDASCDGSEIPVMCCVDEVLRGTNTIERISASAEILDQLAKRRIRIFAATHDMELTDLLREKYVNYHFSETMDGGDVTFSYKLLEGPADSRNAIRLLRALGYDDAIADRAQERAKRFTETGRWTM